MTNFDGCSIAAIVPCYNEEAAIASVVNDLIAAVPEIVVYVYDNASTDRTREVARAAGAIVRTEPSRGKGNVVRRAFADVDADIYLLIDGDDTYDVAAAPAMIKLLLQDGLDHVVGVRSETTDGAFRPGHATGNRLFNRLVAKLFRQPVADMLSGYRVFSRRFVKSFPALSREFEIETELTIHAASLRVPQAEVAVGFRDRPAGSESKLRTYHDGFKILRLIVNLLQHERPALFYGWIGTILGVVGLALGIPVIIQYLQTDLVARFPTAILASSLILLSVLTAMVGLILNGILRLRRESQRLAYLRFEPPPLED